MHLDLTDDEARALLNLLTDAIEKRPLPVLAAHPHPAAASDPRHICWYRQIASSGV
jgi:hypothetical protein